MRSLLMALVLVFSLLLIPIPADAGGSHYVHGYTRRDGTYVAPHWSRNPGSGRSSGASSARLSSGPASARPNSALPNDEERRLQGLEYGPNGEALPAGERYIPPPESAPGYHHVRGYYRRDGTWVAPHWSKNPGTGQGGGASPASPPTSTLSEQARLQGLPQGPNGEELSSGERYIPPPKEEPGRHYVHGYTRRDGTYVRPHWSKNPTGSTRAVPGVRRDSHGRIARSSAERMRFLRSQGLTHTPQGCQVDHIVPLAKGGSDTPSNMQLLCGEALRQKERTELR